MKVEVERKANSHTREFARLAGIWSTSEKEKRRGIPLLRTDALRGGATPPSLEPPWRFGKGGRVAGRTVATATRAALGIALVA
jgi:hypothetical protein